MVPFHVSLAIVCCIVVVNFFRRKGGILTLCIQYWETGIGDVEHAFV